MEGRELKASLKAVLLGLLSVSMVGSVVALAAHGATGDLIGQYETGDRVFDQIEVGGKIVHFHKRMIGQATVEKDFIVYQFDKKTEHLLAKKTHWRDDLPDQLPAITVSREEAESMIAGEIRFTRLYIISPESDVFPIEPTPRNPCWAIASIEDGRMIITIVDAVDGKILGNGVPPPYTGFSLTGPWYFQPCSGGWTSWYLSARDWFNTMGYSTEAVYWPTEDKIKSHIRSHQTALFYELAHGSSDTFAGGCIDGQDEEYTTAYEIYSWMFGHAKMPFTFVGSCGGMCDTGFGSFSYHFRKGSDDSTATVGYCGMAESYCSDCWTVSVSWQDALFGYMDQGWTVKAAFDQANADYPVCPAGNCMRFAGDESFAVVPVVKRDPKAPLVVVVTPDGGETLEYGIDYEIQWSASDNAGVSSIVILLSQDSGSSFPDTIASGETNDGTYLWSVPDIDSKVARIKVVAIDGALNEGEDMSDDDFTLCGSVSGLESPVHAGVPGEVYIEVVSGNPVSSVSSILYGLPIRGDVRIGVYDVSGRLVRKLVEGLKGSGHHTVQWSGTGRSGTRLSSGIYFVRLEAEQGERTVKIIIAK
jgi:hypothetical protein